MYLTGEIINGQTLDAIYLIIIIIFYMNLIIYIIKKTFSFTFFIAYLKIEIKIEIFFKKYIFVLTKKDKYMF